MTGILGSHGFIRGQAGFQWVATLQAGNHETWLLRERLPACHAQGLSGYPKAVFDVASPAGGVPVD